MKRILGMMLLASAFLIGAPHHADAQGRHLGWYKHRERARVIYYRRPVVYRRYYYSEPVYYYHPHRVHIHLPGAGANAGVGVGPIHIGAGIHLHEVMPPPAGPAADPTGISQPMSEVQFAPEAVSPVVMTSVAAPTATMPRPVVAYEDMNVNNYYAIWRPPTTVTVDGFTVPVHGNHMYYSLFKNGRGGYLNTHNTKGVDATRDYGVSPRGGTIPLTIGGSGFPATPVQ